MPRICYVEKNFRTSTRQIINEANAIIKTYQAQGYSLTLRQLYYQFVARDLLANTQKNYSRLGNIINDARLAGLVDWDAIVDRTRNLKRLSTWEDPSSIINSCAHSYRTDKWSSQNYRIEVWIEKEALAGVFERICNELEIPFFSCRGYTSQSEMWRAAMRLRRWERGGFETVILHFGDHDPSGMDMTRDIEERMELFGSTVDVRRLALNMEQIDQYSPPPNPAKMTDSRFASYVQEYGEESWELDALEPQVLSDLVRDEVLFLRDENEWNARVAEQEKEREHLSATSNRWAQVCSYLDRSDETDCVVCGAAWDEDHADDCTRDEDDE